MDSSKILSKYLDEKEGNSLKFMQRMIYLIFSEVVYQRELLPREHFLEKNVFGCELHIPNPSRDRRQAALHNHLKGAADAVTGKRLKQYHLMVHKDRNDPSAASEVFIMEVVYAEDDDGETSMQMSTGALTDVRVCYKGVEELQKQAKNVFRYIRKGLSSLEPIRFNVSFSFYIMYREGVDRSYHPSGYAQAARRYVLPETAEIGDMGMVHAKEHACLLKVKSLMLEDGFQLMQRNAATQMTNSTPSSDPSQEGSNEMMSSDKASSLGIFDDHSEWDETDEEQRKRDQRSAKDQRSLGGESVGTARFEQSPSILDQSMSEVSERSLELGTANEEDFLLASQTSLQQLQQPVLLGRAEETEESDEPMTFASTQSMVTKKLAAAERKREDMERKREEEKERKREEEKERKKEEEKERKREEEKERKRDEEKERKKEKMEMERKKEEKEREPSPDSSVTFFEGSHSSSGNATGSEASELLPQPVRKVSLTKKKKSLLHKASQESTGSDGTTLNKNAEDTGKTAAVDKEPSSGKEADSEPSEEVTVPKKVKAVRKAPARRQKKGTVEKTTTVAEDLVEVKEKEDDETEVPAPKKGKGVKKAKDSEDTVSEKARGSGRTMKSMDKSTTVVDDLEEVKEEEDDETETEVPFSKKTGKRGKTAKQPEDTVSEKARGSRRNMKSTDKSTSVVEDSMEVEQQEIPVPATKKQVAQRGKSVTPKTPSDSADHSSSENSTGKRGANQKSLQETPKKGWKRQEEEEIRTPGVGVMKSRAI